MVLGLLSFLITDTVPIKEHADCPKNVANAIEVARASVAAGGRSEDRRALICLLAAVEAIERQMAATSTAPGSVQQESGQLHLKIENGPRPEARP